jgi:hypothetical protein
MIHRKSIQAALVLAAICLAIVAWSSLRGPKAGSGVALPASGATGAPSETPRGSAMGSAVSPSQPLSTERMKSTSLADSPAPTPSQRYRDASDLRIFVEQAKRSTEPGAGLYATKALEECSAARTAFFTPERLATLRREIAMESMERRAERSAALDVVLGRCASFSLDELSLAESLRTSTWLAAADPWLALQRRLISLSSQDEIGKRALLAEAIAYRDRHLLHQATAVMDVVTASGAEFTGFVDGVPSGGLDQQAYLVARSLAVCKFTSSCGQANEVGLLHECAISGRCATSEEELVRADPSLGDRVVRLADVMAAHLSSGNIDALMPPPKR